MLDIQPSRKRALVASLLLPVGVTAASLLCLPTGPVAGEQAGAKRTVYAWFPARFGSWRTDGVAWECITHLCFRSVELTAEGKLLLPAGNPPREFMETAHRHGVKVTVLVWGSKPGNSDSYLAKYPQECADSLLAYVRANGLDGVNIDDETFREQNSVTGGSNRELVTRFFRTLSRTLKGASPDYHISFAAPPVISQDDRYACKWMDWRAIAESVDAIIPMGYCTNPAGIGWTTNPEPLAGGGKAAWTTTRDLQTMVGDYLREIGGVKEKLLPGVSLSFTGYEWRCRTNTRLSPSIGKGKPISLAEGEERAKLHGARWDEAQQSPWYCHPDGDAFVQGWYNDLKAWNAKLGWIRDQGLGGIGIWVLDGVNDPLERWQALRAYLRPAP